MKKLFILLVFAVSTVVSMNSQNLMLNNPNNKAFSGIRISGDIICPGKITTGLVDIDLFSNGGGFEAGYIYNIPMVANFYIEPGVKLFYNTYSIKKDWVNELSDDIILEGISYKKFGVRIPVMAGYHFDFSEKLKLSLFTGPELEVGISAKECISGHNINASESVYGEDGGMNRVNLLWGLGVGVTYNKLYFGVDGGFGLLDMDKDPDDKFHENRVSISVGYNF